MHPSRELATFINRITYQDLPPAVVAKAKQVILDTIGCAIGGRRIAAEECSWILRLVEELGGPPEAAVWAPGLRTVALNAALANGTMVHTIDFDDTYVAGVAHLGASLVPTVLAVGEKAGVPGEEVLVALVAGFEVAARVAKSVMPSHYKYWHPTATAGAAGAAAAACRLLRLDVDGTEQAIGLAVDQAAGFRYCIDKGDFSKSLHPGWAAMRGIMAAMLAAYGATGPRGLLEYDTGFCRALSEDPHVEALTEGLGREFEIMQDACKLYPAIHCAHSSIEATLHLVTEHDLHPADIEQVQVRMTELARGQGMNYAPDTSLAARLSIPFCLAAAIVHRRITLDEFSPEQMANPDVRGLMPKVTISADPELTRQYPGTFVGLVSIRTREGREYEHFVAYPKGHPRRPATDDEVVEKFYSLVSPSWPRPKAEHLVDLVWHLEQFGSWPDLSALWQE